MDFNAVIYVSTASRRLTIAMYEDILQEISENSFSTDIDRQFDNYSGPNQLLDQPDGSLLYQEVCHPQTPVAWVLISRFACFPLNF